MGTDDVQGSSQIQACWDEWDDEEYGPSESHDIDDAPQVIDLAAIIKENPSEAVRANFYKDLLDLPDLESLKKVVNLLKETIDEPTLVTETFEAWDYLTARELWNGLKVHDTLDKFGMPDPREKAADDLFVAWGLPAEICLPESIRPVNLSSVLLCLLERISRVITPGVANHLLEMTVQNRLSLFSMQEQAINMAQTMLGNDMSEFPPDLLPVHTEYDVDNEHRRFTRGQYGSNEPYVLIWDVLDILKYATTHPGPQQPEISNLALIEAAILAEIKEGVALLLEGIELSQYVSTESSEYCSEQDELEYKMEFACLCNYSDYDNKDFFEFPPRMGWEVQPKSNIQLRKTNGADYNVKQASAFLQLWLFFGTLVETLGLFDVRVEAKDFIRHDGKEPLITFMFLDQYLLTWARRFEELDPRKLEAAVQGAKQILSVVAELVNISAELSIQEDVMPPICQLLMIFQRLYSAASGQRYDKVRQDRNNLFNFVPSSKMPAGLVPAEHEDEWFVIDYHKMRKAGWCPRDVKKLIRDPIMANNWYYYYASTLDRQVAGRDHKNCNQKICLLQDVKTNEYKRRHWDKCQNCEDIAIDVNQVKAVLEQGKVARILITTTNTPENDDLAPTGITLSVVDDGPYISISHVWSDGLGNPGGNSMPSCQLLRLKSQAAKLLDDETSAEDSGDATLPKDVAIWIDTLCVPVEDTGRKLALRQLGQAYEEANYVLVLDDELQQKSLHCREEERMMRILLSGWMQRLWTLEEAALGRDRLRFQFLEGAISLPANLVEQRNQFWSLNASTEAPMLSMNIAVVATDRLPYPSQFEVGRHCTNTESSRLHSELYEGPNPLSLLEGLQLRMTTKLEDEFLCVSSLMRLDVKKIAEYKTAAERAKVFWLLLSERRIPVPTQLLFSPEPKLEVDGLRWAPKSLLSLSDYAPSPLLADNISGSYFNVDGLYCRCPAYILLDLPNISKCKYVLTTYEDLGELWEPATGSWKDLSTFISNATKFERGNFTDNCLVLLLHRLNDRSQERQYDGKDNLHQALLARVEKSQRSPDRNWVCARYIAPLRCIEPGAIPAAQDLHELLASEVVAQVEVAYQRHTDWTVG